MDVFILVLLVAPALEHDDDDDDDRDENEAADNGQDQPRVVLLLPVTRRHRPHRVHLV